MLRIGFGIGKAILVVYTPLDDINVEHPRFFVSISFVPCHKVIESEAACLKKPSHYSLTLTTTIISLQVDHLFPSPGFTHACSTKTSEPFLPHSSTSTDLSPTKIHLGMLLHELFQQILLFLLVTAGLPLPLHLLVVHHLLDHPARLAVEFRQLGVFGLDLGHVDCGGGRHDVRPPVGAAGFGQVDVDGFGGVGVVGGDDPGRIVDEDGVREVALFFSC